jgi:hypothetical protein
MSQIIPKKKNSIKILLLCSYDSDTLRIVRKLSDKIIKNYGSEDYEWSGRIIPIIAKNVRVYHTESYSHHYCIFSQQYKDKWSLTVFKNTVILDRIQCTEAEHENLLREVQKTAIYSKGKYREMKATPKIIELCKWSDIIFIIKILPLTRGGELIELTMIVCKHLFQRDKTVNKVVLFKKRGVKLSWMAKEMIDLGKIRSHTFNDFEKLWEFTEKELELLIKNKGFQAIPLL